MNRAFLLRRHWKLLALSVLVLVLLMTVLGSIEITAPEIPGTTTG